LNADEILKLKALFTQKKQLESGQKPPV
ncbi:MAG: hypothetical protein JWM03_822, partial [Rhodocyclales bacterium]|nr:hypothetical protein [Rhodocyclales bacterium]